MRIVLYFALLSLLLLNTGCRKNNDSGNDDKTPVEMHVNGVWQSFGGSASGGGYSTNMLGVLYNRVINAEINIVVLLHRYDGKKDTSISITIPAGYKNLVASDPSGSGVMNYYEKNIGNSYSIISTEVVSVNCADKSYSFSSKVDTGTTLDFKTSVFFISNKDTLIFNEYSYQTISTYSANQMFTFNFGPTLRVVSDSLQTSLHVGQSIHLPYFRYYGPYTDHGTEIDNNGIAPRSGSTVSLTVTRKDDKSFDGTFAGKVWSAKETDTLYIKEGKMFNVKLPLQ